MCKECGCGEGGRVQINGCDAHAGAHSHEHHHEQHHEHSRGEGHAHEHDHATHGHSHAVGQPLLDANDRQAERNRGWFEAKNVHVLNVLSSPGSGKTTLLAETLRRLEGTLRAAVIVGDLATDNDARRLRETGVPVIQITTGTMCHLDATMIAEAARQLDADALDLLIIENVGNLVCPADYDLGENARVVLLATTEGEDKPLKYPPVFHAADLAVITKTDLAQAAGFDRAAALASLERVAHHARVCEVSAKTGDGMEAWCSALLNTLGFPPAACAPSCASR